VHRGSTADALSSLISRRRSLCTVLLRTQPALGLADPQGHFQVRVKERTGQYASLIAGRAHTSECIGKADSGYSMACAPLPFLLSIPQRRTRRHAARAAPPAVAVSVGAYSVFYPPPPQARATRKQITLAG